MNPKDILNFPKMLAVLLWQLVYYSLTEVETFLLALVGALYGYQLGVVWGVTIFFTGYLIVRMVGGWTSLIASKLHLIGSVMHKSTKADNE
jgi:hypothetical protein